MNRTVILSETLSLQADRKWQEFCLSCEKAGMPIINDSDMIQEIRRMFAFSEFVSRICITDPATAIRLIQSKDYERIYYPLEYTHKLRAALEQVQDESEMIRALSRIRTYEMLRIAWRDLSGRADLTQTMTELSAFADACLEETLSVLYDWQRRSFGTPFGVNGTPQKLVILAMGKLGAGELNFSSDIDLMFAYPENGETHPYPLPSRSPAPSPSSCDTERVKGVTIRNDEFFTKLCRRLLNVLGSQTAGNRVFRVDMRLRPFGESGPIVMSFDAMLDYYQVHGREWERYALIRARTAAGDKTAGDRLLEMLNPFVFRKYLDYGVFESLRDMKRMISLEVSRKGLKDNIKLGPGGIREVEFFAHVFQLIRGGVESELQTRNIRQTLRLLVQNQYISPEVSKELEDGYVFLRNTEHRLQEYADSQIHDLPSDSLRQSALAASLGFETYEAFSQYLDTQRKQIHAHFIRLLEAKDETPEDQYKIVELELESVWRKFTDEEQSQKILISAGFTKPNDVLAILEDFRTELNRRPLSIEGRKRIEALIPKVLRKTGTADNPEITLTHVIELVKTVERRTSYIALLLEYPVALTHLVRLVSASPWIASFLKKHPVLLDELLDTRTLYVPPKRLELEEEIRQRLFHQASDDMESQMEALRLFKQSSVLRVAAADITNAMPLMKVSDHLSDIAETVINAAVDLSWNHLTQKYGTPIATLNGKPCQKGFAVIAYGKLGGLEHGYASDLDLVFLHAGTPEPTQDGISSIDSPQFFARLGQRVIHILTAHTYGGVLYETDMRLRPDGSSGILVTHIEAFRTYLIEKAWTWEKQALIKARAVSGGARLRKRFEQIRREVLAQERDETVLKTEVSQMRQKMRESLSTPKPDIFDLKQDPGGMVDVEFLVQYLVLRHAHRYPELLVWTDNVRLIRTLMDAGVIDDITAYILRKAFLTYRSLTHRFNLQQKPAYVSADRFMFLRENVRKIWERFL